ncbi:MAG: PepSY-associated TM helix domain-containing protein [Myxococcota bacterium]
MSHESPRAADPPAKAPSFAVRWFEAHSVAGVTLLVPFFVMALTGTISLFHEELRAWHTPALRLAEPPPVHAVDALLTGPLADTPRDAARIHVRLPTRWAPLITVRSTDRDREDLSMAAVDPADGSTLPGSAVSSELAHHLFHWHFLHPLPQGLLLAGFLSVLWLALTVSGLVMHRRKLLSQFRGWGKRRARALHAWIHAAAGTATVPFSLIFGMTGAFLGLSSLLLPVIVLLVFAGDIETAQPALGFDQPPPLEVVGERVDRIPPLDPFVADALAQRPGLELTRLDLQEPFDRAARLTVGLASGDGENARVAYDIHESEEPVFVSAPEEPLATQVFSFGFMLHFATFGGYAVKVLYALAGILFCWLTYAGAQMYISRKRKHAPRTAKVVERLFDGLGLGLLPAIGIFAWANRWLPEHLAHRGEVEIHVFHIAWALIGVLVLTFGTSRRRRAALVYGSVALLATVPLIDGWRYGVWPWSSASWVVPSVGITSLLLLATGLVCLVSAIARGQLSLPSSSKEKLPELSEGR